MHAKRLIEYSKGGFMNETSNTKDKLWASGTIPTLAMRLPEEMHALLLHRDQYGPPGEILKLEKVPTPQLNVEDANKVLVSVLATGPNFNSNFAALGLPVPVFGKGDSAAVHIPGSDALGIVVDAGAAVTQVKVGQAVILDSWTSRNIIRGYETHDGFNAQFAVVDEIRAIPVPPALSGHTPERLAAMMLTYGTAYRAIVERLAVKPGDAVLLMGGGKGTSFAGAQIAKSLGARVILVGSNPQLAESLIQRGIADAFVDRCNIPAEVFGLIPAEMTYEQWQAKTEAFRKVVFAANNGNPVDKIFEHTGGRNFPLLVSVLAEKGTLAFFGATGQGIKGEYKETFFYDKRRFVLDARWVWMRQKQIIFRDVDPNGIFTEIGLLPGRIVLIWGADAYAIEFAKAALTRGARIAVIASRSKDSDGIAEMMQLGLAESALIDRDEFEIPEDMPDPLTDNGTPNPAYNQDFMAQARAIGRAIWGIFGPRTNPDVIVERPDQSTLHLSTFLLRDFTEDDAMPCGYVVLRGKSDLSILGSHMYHDTQAKETIRLLSQGQIVMEQDDLEITTLAGLPAIQQKMLEGRMDKPKGVALVQADRAGRTVASFEAAFLGESLRQADPAQNRYLDIHLLEGIAIVTLKRLQALNALNTDLLSQISEVANEINTKQSLMGKPVSALILKGAGRAFVAGADVNQFMGNTPEGIAQLAAQNIGVFSNLENLPVPVISLIDGFALGGGNELAMSTHYRIVTENAMIGQPEVKLGIIPGYGGMQRLPRLVGPWKASEMSINGEALDGRTAVAIGLADEFCPSSTALRNAFEVARDLASGAKAWNRRNWDGIALDQKAELADLLQSAETIDLLNTQAPDAEQAKDLRTARKYAGKMALLAVQFGYENGFSEGLENDARLFGEITASLSGQEWVSRFLKKDPLQSSFLTLISSKRDR
jgi:enoyl-CoA hydratase